MFIINVNNFVYSISKNKIIHQFLIYEIIMVNKEEEIQIAISTLIEIIYEQYIKDLKNGKLKNNLYYSEQV